MTCTKHGTRPTVPSRVVTRRLTRPSRPLRSFAPPGSPFTSDRHPGRATKGRSVLSWAGSPLELAPARSWVRSVAVHVVRDEPGFDVTPGDRPPRSRGETRSPTPGSRARSPPTRWFANHADLPPGSDSTIPTFASRGIARRQPRPPAPARARSTAFGPRPLSAAPRASHALRPETPARGAPGWTSETH